MGTLNYKGYIGSVNYSVEDDCLYGKVMGLTKNITIIYEGESIKDLRTDFENAIDNYLNNCEEKGIAPQKTYSGRLNVSIPIDLHIKIAMLAMQNGESINSFVRNSLEDSVKVQMQ
ncbi:MAG: type II toxin-antitoxin system HicB family antitoxin [Bacteroidales bacterium]|nr:type II toxin-antitoxin system HicB family antitoxin [Bacteroidales bacterium]